MTKPLEFNIPISNMADIKVLSTRTKKGAGKGKKRYVTFNPFKISVTVVKSSYGIRKEAYYEAMSRYLFGDGMKDSTTLPPESFDKLQELIDNKDKKEVTHGMKDLFEGERIPHGGDY